MAKEYIEREALVSEIKRIYCTDCNNYNEIRCRACGTDDALRMVEDAPTADVVEVVRCKDCKHWRYETEERIEHYECNIFCGAYDRGYPTGADDYCSYGERKGGNGR